MRLTGDRFVRRFLLTVLLAAAAAGSAMAGDVDLAKSAADALGEAATARYGSPGAFQENAAKPATSRETPMTTLNGAFSFDAQLSCPSTSRFLAVLVQPSGTGDLSLVRVSQDTDLDGTDDHLYTVPFDVSGVCANGLIGCDPGTWDHCRYWEWTTDEQGRAGLAASTPGRLGGCYCVNAHCGSGLVWNNLDVILGDIGGGVVNAVQATSRRYAVTDARVDGPSIVYYGQNLTECSRVKSAYGDTDPGRLYSPTSDAGLLSAGESELQAQSLDEDSPYRILSDSAAASGSESTYQSCAIKRNVVVEQIAECDPPGYYDTALRLCVLQPNELTPQLFATGGCNSGCHFSPREEEEFIYGFTIDPCGGGGVYIGNYLCGDPCGGTGKRSRIILRCNGRNVIVHGWESNVSYIPACPTCDLTWVDGYYYTRLQNEIDCNYYPGATPGVNGQYCQVPPDFRDVLTETVSDQCQALDAGSGCRLKDEKVDGVTTYRNYSPTRLEPVGSCRSFSGYLVHDICRDWWDKERVYFCQDDGRFDFDDIKERSRVIHESVTGGTGEHQYKDVVRDASGQWVTSGGTFDTSLAEGNAPQPCEIACKTRKPKTDTQAGTTGVTTDYRKSGASYDLFFRRCEKGRCPAGDDEEILKDCQCISDFAEAATATLMINNAAKDMICSSGTKQ